MNFKENKFVFYLRKFKENKQVLGNNLLEKINKFIFEKIDINCNEFLISIFSHFTIANKKSNYKILIEEKNKSFNNNNLQNENENYLKLKYDLEELQRNFICLKNRNFELENKEELIERKINKEEKVNEKIKLINNENEESEELKNLQKEFNEIKKNGFSNDRIKLLGKITPNKTARKISQKID